MRHRDFRAELEEDIIELADQGLETRNATLVDLMDRAGLGPDSCWEVDLGVDHFVWRGEKGDVVSPVQVLGTLNPEDNSWLWAWANPSLPLGRCAAAQKVREFGEERRVRPLTTRQLRCEDDQKWVLDHIAIGLGLGRFVYLGHQRQLEIHLLLTDPQVEPR
jgi:hypothetical protein